MAPRGKQPWVPGLALPLNTAWCESLLSLGTEMDQLWAGDLIISFKPYNNTVIRVEGFSLQKRNLQLRMVK